MTMQIGMVATNGVVIASDTKWYDDTSGVRHTSSSTKHCMDSARGIAVACSGSDVSRLVGQKIVEELAIEDYSNPRFSVTQIAKSIVGRLDHTFASCLIVLRGNNCIRLFSLDMKVNEYDFCEQNGIIWKGDITNSAVFFGEAYYSRRPTNDLLVLGAHTILTAEKRNSGGIGGLEILVCNEEGFNLLSESELDELRNTSAKIEAFERESLGIR